MPARLLFFDAPLAELLDPGGDHSVAAPTPLPDPTGFDAVVTRSPAALRVWRLAGHSIGIIGVGSGVSARAGLEPLVTLSEMTPAGLQRALALLSRGTPRGALRLSTGRLDLDRRVLLQGTAEVTLTQREADLLAYLASRQREVSRDELRVQVWGHRSTARPSRAIDMAIMRLRKKIEPDPSSPRHLIAIRGGGYRLVHSDTAPAAPLHADTFGRTTLIEGLIAWHRQGRGRRVLTGAPGIGKTHLARALCRHLPEAVWIDVSLCRDVEDVCAAICEAHGVRGGTPRSPTGRITRLLRHHGGLVVLDGADHLARELAEATAAWADQVPVLVTSQVWSAGDALTVPPLTPADATALFYARAPRHAGADLSPLGGLLEGVPLVIELLAAHARELSLADVATLLAHTDGALSHTAQSMAESLDIALARLTPQQQAHLAALSIFPGVLSLQLAAVLIDLPVVEALSAMEALIAASMLQRRDGEVRILTVIRTTAQQHRPEAADTARRRLAGWVAEQAALLLPQLGGPRDIEAVSWACANRPTLVMACTQLSGTALSQVGLLLNEAGRHTGSPAQRVADLTPILHVLEETGPADACGRIRAALALAMNSHTPEQDCSAAFRLAIDELTRAGELEEAAMVRVQYASLRAERSDRAGVLERLGDPDALPGAARWVGTALALLQRFYLGESLPLLLTRIWACLTALDRAGRYEPAVNVAYFGINIAFNQGQRDEVRALVALIERLSAPLANRSIYGLMRYYQGFLAMSVDDYAGARDHLEEAVATLTVHGRSSSATATANTLSWVRLHLGDHDGAAAQISELLVALTMRGDQKNTRYALVIRACLELDQGALQAARRTGRLLEESLSADASLQQATTVRVMQGVIAMAAGEHEAAQARLRDVPLKGGASNFVQSAAACAVLSHPDPTALAALEAALSQHTVPGHAALCTLADALRARNHSALIPLSRPDTHVVVRLLARAALRNIRPEPASEPANPAQQMHR